MAVATRSQFALAGFDLMRCIFGPATLPLRPLEWVTSIPGILAFILASQVALKGETVPGANDDLSGCAALPVLASRLIGKVGDDVELVFVVTGCEECSMGGADALVRAKKGEWSKDNTVFVGLDCLSGERLNYMDLDSEVKGRRVPKWLSGLVDRTAAEDDKFKEVAPFDIPVGGTDIAVALAHGYDGVSFVCLDPSGSPPNYHQPSDTPENMDYDKLIFCTDFVEKVTHAIIAERLAE